MYDVKTINEVTFVYQGRTLRTNVPYWHAIGPYGKVYIVVKKSSCRFLIYNWYDQLMDETSTIEEAAEWVLNNIPEWW